MTDPTVPGEREAAARIVAATRMLVQKKRAQLGAGLRDVHPKHHGCVLARLVVRTDLPAALQQGLLQPGAAPYRAWVRFSNSSKLPQSDEIADGRGVAIKLLGVRGPRLDGGAEEGEQDLLLLNHPAFFARDAAEMAEVAEREAADAFPGGFFLRLDRVRGLRAFLGMAVADVDSPLALSYFSQTPYRLGDLRVKLRLTPLSHAPAHPGDGPRRAGHSLFHALRAQLAPPVRATGAPVADPSEVAASFELAVQVHASEHDAVEDATVVWRGPFVPVARLELPPQHVGGDAQWQLAERIAFNPWNGLAAHEPLGGINRVRKLAYEASRAARQGEGRAPMLTLAHWDAALLERSASGDLGWSPPPLPRAHRAARTLRALFPTATAWLAQRAAKLSYVLAATLFAGVAGVGSFWPAYVLAPLSVGLAMPSEALIPALAPSARGRARLDAEGVPRAPDPTWAFRYEPTGSELGAGIPYWMFRALPRMFPEQFHHRDDWSRFGLYREDDDAYYTSYRGLPRGVVLSDTRVSLGGNQLEITLKRVSLNCASCHRGEVVVGGRRHFIDGMPNVGIDTASYKQVVFAMFDSPRFTASRLIDEIDQLLAEAQPGSPSPERLTAYERFVYRAIVQVTKARAKKKPLAWMRSRPANGVGRLDAFGALRFEFLTGYDPAMDGAIATVDLPSIWNQRASVRARHHWDGNTRDVEARNFGAIVGVGAAEPSIRRERVAQVSRWIDQLPSPRFHALAGRPIDRAQVERGRRHYEAHRCASCHGRHDADGNLTGELPGCMRDAPISVDTDPARAAAVDDDFAAKLNAFGSAAGLWGTDAFVSSAGRYLCPPLDGIWARAPYLHNGAVPTLEALLMPPDARPETFWRGHPEYDPEAGGFRTHPPLPGDPRALFLLDTREPGNARGGHAYVVPPADRADLIAYLLTL